MSGIRVATRTHRCKKSCAVIIAFCVLSWTILPVYAERQAPSVPVKAKSSKPAPPKPLVFVPGSWTLVLLPDIQNYSTRYPGLTLLQTSWVLQNQRKNNIQFVLQLGDVTNYDSPCEWRRARDSFALLNGKVPYAIVEGNHDHYLPAKKHVPEDIYETPSYKETGMDHFFPVSSWQGLPSFGGVMEKGRVENSYHLFSAGGCDWLVLVLEWAPRDEVVAWANSICDKYPTRKAILATHAYLYSDSTRYDFATKGKSQEWNPHSYPTSGSVNDGEELWHKLIKKHNFVFTFNGHVCHNGTGFLSSKNDLGKTTHQMLVNYQTRPLGGEGYLRLVEILPDGKTVHIRSYSPLFDKFLTEPDQQFVFTLK